ncbi:MAG: type I-E CRISPR-associated protein Cse1/CasA [Gemmatimonadaceae bacterium]|nr:type I-E CRISPR-associated protein Cse1/CasA [Gemmatimonadaceae bacterium]MBA3558871.1 type I-E CRISPR-associated protein Cse1/CasA [Gemmatimonadaceae bacterium]
MSGFDLRSENWIPMRRRSGRVEWGAPHLIVDDVQDDPIVSLASARPDFNGALTEFLVGLLTVALHPEKSRDWGTFWQTPPSQTEFVDALAALPPAFDLDGDGFRFLQDSSPEDLESSEHWSVESLLIGSPGTTARDASRRTHVTDLFVKAGRVTRMSRSTAATALLTMQTYAPEGGRGHLTSLRGGGPLTTLVDPRKDDQLEPLWRKLWANVETKTDLRNRSTSNANSVADIFPWMGPTRASDPPSAHTTTPDQVSPLQAYFGLPRRIRLEFGGPGTCDITGTHDENTVVGFRMRAYGTKYRAWKHPLSPYYKAKGEYFPVHGKQGGVAWRDWMGIALEAPSDEVGAPAAVIQSFKRRSTDLGLGIRKFRLHAFGFDTRQNKARGWTDAALPVFVTPGEDRQQRLYTLADALTNATGIVSTALLSGVKTALFYRAQDKKKADFSHFTDQLWSATEGEFYFAIEAIARSGVQDDIADELVTHTKQGFGKVLHRNALEIFDRSCPNATFEPVKVRRRIAARYDLVMSLTGYSKLGQMLFERLEIPIPTGAWKKGGRKRSQLEAGSQ